MKNKVKKFAKVATDEIKHEILGEPKPKQVLPKRSTMDVILGRFPKPQNEEVRPSPIVEAMLQTKKSEEENAKKSSVDALDIQMQKVRQQRLQSEGNWSQTQTSVMQNPKVENSSGALLPASPQKGPAQPAGHGKPKGMEQIRKRN